MNEIDAQKTSTHDKKKLPEIKQMKNDHNSTQLRQNMTKPQLTSF
jgi:hypothetical protein